MGVLVGYLLGNQAGTRDIVDFGPAILFGLGLLTLAIVAVVAAVAWLIGRPATRRLAGSLAVAAGAYAVGGVLAYGAALALGSAAGAAYPEPVAAGVRLELEGDGWEPAPDAWAECAFSPDGTVTLVNVPLAGRLQGQDLTVEVDLAGARRANQEAELSLGIDTPDQPGSLGRPRWAGRVPITELTASAQAGRLRFAGLRTDADPSDGPERGGWPERLSGQLSWTCG